MADHRRAERHRAGGAGGDGGMDRQLPRQPELHRRGRPARRPAGARGIESLSPAQRDVLAVLPQLNAVQNLAGDAPSWAEGYGLYQGDMLGEESASVYRRLLIAVFAPRLVTRIEEQLRSGGSSDFLYEGLKAYLMLGSPDHYDADFIKAWISLDWERNLPRDLSPEQRQALHAHLDALLERRPPSAPWTRTWSRTCAAVAATTGGAARSTTGSSGRGCPRTCPTSRISDAAGRGRAAGVRAQERRAAHRPAQRLLHLPRLSRGVPHRQPQPAGTIAEEQWVLGRDLNDAGDAASLALDVRRLYFQDYLRQWDDLLADLTVVPITNVTQAADVLRILSGPTSPFRKLLEAVARETDLQKGDRLVAAQSEEGRRRHRGQAQAAPRLAGRPGGRGRPANSRGRSTATRSAPTSPNSTAWSARARAATSRRRSTACWKT
ncbi:ImcF-related family protein [Pseudomonas aeruginosa]